MVLVQAEARAGSVVHHKPMAQRLHLPTCFPENFIRSSVEYFLELVRLGAAEQEFGALHFFEAGAGIGDDAQGGEALADRQRGVLGGMQHGGGDTFSQNAEEGKVVVYFVLVKFLQATAFGRIEEGGVEAMLEGIGIAGLTATRLFGRGPGRRRRANHLLYLFIGEAHAFVYLNPAFGGDGSARRETVHGINFPLYFRIGEAHSFKDISQAFIGGSRRLQPMVRAAEAIETGKRQGDGVQSREIVLEGEVLGGPEVLGDIGNENAEEVYFILEPALAGEGSFEVVGGLKGASIEAVLIGIAIAGLRATFACGATFSGRVSALVGGRRGFGRGHRSSTRRLARL